MRLWFKGKPDQKESRSEWKYRKGTVPGPEAGIVQGAGSRLRWPEHEPHFPGKAVGSSCLC